MRVARNSVLFALGLMLLGGTRIEAASRQEYLSGTLLSPEGMFPPAMTLVSLKQTGIPVGVAYTDSAGRFTFRNVRPGLYTIHVQLEGYEDLDRAVEVSRYSGFGADSTFMLVRKYQVIRQSGPQTIDVSQFLERYPKKAVEAYKKGLKSSEHGKTDAAIKHFEEAVKLAPEFFQAYNELGILYRRAGRAEDAETAFLRAHYLNDSSADPLINLTGLYIDADKPDDAVATGEKAIKRNGRSAPAFLNLGMALYKLAKLDRAEAVLKKALELAPKMAQVRLMLANVYLKLRRYDNVMEQLDTYLAENPKGEHREAVEEMRHALLSAQGEQQP
jgi:tetratricopeptide (TPR) repeat protein